MNNLICVKDDSDVLRLEKLAEKIWNQHFVPIIGKPQVDYMLEKFQSFEPMKVQISEGMNYYLLSIDSEDVAYCGFKKDGNRVFLSKLYVKLEHRGKGLSKVLLNKAKEFASANGLHAVYLTVNKHNDDTINIYKHIGFEVIDSVVTDIANGFVMDDYIMQLELKQE